MFRKVDQHGVEEQRWAPPVRCLLYLDDARELRPIAIMLGRDPAQDPVFTPNDSEHDWLAAKIYARCSEGNVHQIRELIDEHPHTVHIRAADPRRLAREFLTRDDVLSMRFEPGAVVVETSKPDMFYARLTEMAATGEFGVIDEVTSPDDNLQAVFQYLVK